MASVEIYHLCCYKCHYDWWSREAFPKICPKCGENPAPDDDEQNDESTKKPFFETQEEFINWISIYYPAPHHYYEGYGHIVGLEQYKKNVESWKNFFENLKKHE